VKTHTRKFGPTPALALARVDAAREQSALIVVEALDSCPASEVSRVLRCSPDLVRRWGRGQGSPTVAQVMASPERFARSLLAAAGRVYAPPPVEVVEVPVAESLGLLLSALGALIAATPGGVDDLAEYTDEELTRRDESLKEVEREAGAQREAIRRVREARAEQPREEKAPR